MTALTEEQSRLVEQNLPRVRTLARIVARTVSHADIDELYSAGAEGLVEAALRYDPSSGTAFAAFFHYRVRGAMIDAARRAAPQVRRRSRALRALAATQALLEHAQLGQPSGDTGDPRSLRERVEAAAQIVAQTTAAVLLARLGPADPEAVPTPEASAEDCLAHAQTIEQLRMLVDGSDAQSQAIVAALYVEGISMHEHAARIGVSVSTVSRAHARLLARLATALQDPSPQPATRPPPPPTRAAPDDPIRPTASARGPPGRPES
jgi:RNA polymerase sigma factor for flagellar operon FliA